MGVVLYDTDRFEEAREHFQYCADAMLRRSNLSALDLGTLAAYFGNLADTEMALGRRGPAESFLNQSESNYQKAGAVRQPVQLAISKQRRASLLQLKGEWPAAEKEWLTLTRSLMRYAMENFAFQSESEKTQFWSSVSVPFRKFRSFAIDRAAQNPDILGTLYDLQLATKGILLSSSNRIRKRMLGSRDSTLINQYYQWMRLRERLGQLYAQPGHRASATDSLSQSINILEKEMNVTAEDIRDETGGPPVTWQQVQASLGPDEAAVEILRFRYFNGYVRDSVIYAALVLTDKTLRAPALVIIPDGKRLEKQYYAAYKNAMTYQMDDTVSYRRYWAPLTKVIGRRGKVYLSLDGVYHQLSLAALRSPDGKYLADLKSLTIVSNTKDVLSVKSRKPTRNRSFSASLFGFPSFYLGDDQKKEPGASRGGMEPLTGTRIEVDRISALLAESHVRTEVFVGERATEGAIKHTRQPTLLHIATHGFFQEEGKPAAFNLTGVNEGNPLNRTGLLLAGAANYVQEGQLTDDENGILTAYEVSNLNLESAELVALSACETGRGVVQNGEGVYGLQRAFQSAGARSILLSLWKVDDAATQRLMSEFYRNWLQGQGKAEALRRAQVTVKAEFPHPYYWGAFILMEN
jgi:CHAT domain-containing protein